MFQSASASWDNRFECYTEGRAQSVVGFGLDAYIRSTYRYRDTFVPAHVPPTNYKTSVKCRQVVRGVLSKPKAEDMAFLQVRLYVQYV